MHFTWVSQPCNAKNTVNTTVFDSGLQAARGGVNIDSINKSAGAVPGIFLAKARGTPASRASFRDNLPLARTVYFSFRTDTFHVYAVQMVLGIYSTPHLS